MGDLSEHFDRSEFACHDGCGRDSIDAETLRVVERLRDHFGAAVTINSAFRCENHNRSVGGASNSQHLTGRACDVVVEGVGPDSVAQHLETTYEDRYGIGRYNTFTHVDTRSGPPARWEG
jgi:uncharacterized protein YcbK (DUF882 family)